MVKTIWYDFEKFNNDIRSYMIENNLKPSNFSRIIEMDRGYFSKALNGKVLFSEKYFNKICAIIGKEPKIYIIDKKVIIAGIPIDEAYYENMKLEELKWLIDELKTIFDRRRDIEMKIIEEEQRVLDEKLKKLINI